MEAFQEVRFIWSKLRVPLGLVALAFVAGAVGYKLLYPEEPWVRLFFHTAITISTVGYGDVLRVEDDALASWYTMGVMLVGMGLVLYAISSITAFLIDGQLAELLFRQSVRRKVSRMDRHYIVCGCGRTGAHVVRELSATERPFVVIEHDPEAIRELRQEMPSCLAIVGDATADTVLEEANIKNARGLVAALPSDKENLFLTISARLLNPNLTIASKAVDLSITKKLMKAGANHVVCPNLIGGLRIASQLLRPNVVSFLDRMLRDKEKSMRIEEVEVPAESPLIGRGLGGSGILEETGINVIAYAKDGAGGGFSYNPDPAAPVEAGGVLLFIGSVAQRERLEAYVAGEEAPVEAITPG